MPCSTAVSLRRYFVPLAVLQRLPGVVHLDVEPPGAPGDVRGADRGGGRAGPARASPWRRSSRSRTRSRRSRDWLRVQTCGDRCPSGQKLDSFGPRVGGVDVVRRAARRTGPDDLLGQARVGVERLAAVDPDDAEVAAGGQRAAALRVGHVVAALAGGQRDRRCLGTRRRHQHRAGSQRGRPRERSKRYVVRSAACSVPRVEMSGLRTLSEPSSSACQGVVYACGPWLTPPSTS